MSNDDKSEEKLSRKKYENTDKSFKILMNHDYAHYFNWVPLKGNSTY